MSERPTHASRLQVFLALLRARNTEYFRDRGALSWSFIFPLLIIAGCALAFSRPNPTLFRLGLYGDSAALRAELALQLPYVELIEIDDLARAQQRIRHHQLDLLVADDGRYWHNPTSGKGDALLRLLQPALTERFREEQLEGRAVRYVDWVLPGVIGMNMMFSALFGVGYVIVRYRQNGVLKRLQATPVSALQFIGAQLVSRLWIVLGVASTIALACIWLLDLLQLGSYALLLLIALLGAMSMISLGLLVASRTASEEFAGGLLNAVTWPMMFLSEVWFPLDNAPLWLQRSADLMPLTHLVKAARAVMVEGAGLSDVLYHLAWLAAITLLCTVAAARLFRWHAVR
jgi:ABC-type multidrug transport system permease subunit